MDADLITLAVICIGDLLRGKNAEAAISDIRSCCETSESERKDLEGAVNAEISTIITGIKTSAPLSLPSCYESTRNLAGNLEGAGINIRVPEFSEEDRIKHLNALIDFFGISAVNSLRTTRLISYGFACLIQEYESFYGLTVPASEKRTALKGFDKLKKSAYERVRIHKKWPVEEPALSLIPKGIMAAVRNEDSNSHYMGLTRKIMEDQRNDLIKTGLSQREVDYVIKETIFELMHELRIIRDGMYKYVKH